MSPPALLLMALVAADATPPPAEVSLPALLQRTSSDVLNSLRPCTPTPASPLVLCCPVQLPGGSARASFAFDLAQVVQTIGVEHPPATSRAAALAALQPWIARLAQDWGRPTTRRAADHDEVTFARPRFRAVMRTARAADGTWTAHSELSDPSRGPRDIPTR